MKTRDLLMIAALAAPLTLGACSSATSSAGTVAAPAPATATTAPPSATPAPGTTGMTSAEIEAVYRARIDSLRTVFTPADAEFMAGMIHHHAQAIEMSLKAPTHSSNPSIQTLAARIINAQEGEIAIMQTWLRDRKQAVPELHRMDGRVMVHAAGHGDHEVHMPGMITAEQMAELDRARGPEFDRLFLTYMIAHHRGAVTMVRDLFATDGAGIDDTVFKFASDIQADQSSEVARMERMLAALTPTAPEENSWDQ